MRLACVVTAAIWLAACSSPEKAAKDARAAATSWDATLTAAQHARDSGAISASYFTSVVTQAVTSLTAEAQTARKEAGDQAAVPVERVKARAEALR